MAMPLLRGSRNTLVKSSSISLLSRWRKIRETYRVGGGMNNKFFVLHKPLKINHLQFPTVFDTVSGNDRLMVRLVQSFHKMRGLADLTSVILI